MILSTPTDEIGVRKIAKKILNNKVLIVSVWWLFLLVF